MKVIVYSIVLNCMVTIGIIIGLKVEMHRDGLVHNDILKYVKSEDTVQLGKFLTYLNLKTPIKHKVPMRRYAEYPNVTDLNKIINMLRPTNKTLLRLFAPDLDDDYKYVNVKLTLHR